MHTVLVVLEFIFELIFTVSVGLFLLIILRGGRDGRR